MKVKSVKKINITPPKDGVRDHNIYIDTDSVFFSAVPIMDCRYPNWDTESQEIIANYVDGIAGEVQDYLNAFYDILAKRFFNIDEHRLQIKKEYVAKAGIWVAKKRYAQWIISDNGKVVDKLDVKGLDVVRSSFPEAMKKLMKTVLINILRGDTKEQVSEIILDFKKTITKFKPEEIAKNSAVKELGKYKKKTTNKLFDFQKGTPAHVKAAIAYNDLLTHFHSAYKYEPMKSGDKIKWVYLKNNPLGLDAVGFTGYKDPPEIVDFINKYIHHDKIFERELLGKLEDFYKSLKWGPVINEQKTASQFFQF